LNAPDFDPLKAKKKKSTAGIKILKDRIQFRPSNKPEKIGGFM